MRNDTPEPRLAALRYRDFRLLWLGQLISQMGTQMQFIAVNWHVYRLLRDESYTLSLFGRSFALGVEAMGLGVLGLVRVLPVMLFALVGGILADTHDRRLLLIQTQLVAALLALVLAAVTLSGSITVWALYALTAAGAAVSAFDEPAEQAFVPQLVPRRHLSNALSLNILLWQIGTIVGPAIGGVLLASFDIGLVYVLNALSFGAVVVALLLIRYRPAAREESGVPRPVVSWGAMLEGFHFIRRSQIMWSTMLLDFWATFFSSARTMLPIVAGQMLGVGAAGYGLLATAQPVGAQLAGLYLSLRREIRRQGVVLLGSVVVYGLATALFGLSGFVALSYVLFALTGVGDTVSTVIRQTLRQTLTPDHLRGRMVGVNMVLLVHNSSLQMERPAPLLPHRLPIPLPA